MRFQTIEDLKVLLLKHIWNLEKIKVWVLNKIPENWKVQNNSKDTFDLLKTKGVGTNLICFEFKVILVNIS
jgi:hypothetical protein